MPAVGAARRQLRLPVPTTILTGALASGKTTAIARLLQSKPPEEVWAVLINEFGAAGLDAALLEGGAATAAAAAASPPPLRAAGAGAGAGSSGSSGSSGSGEVPGVHIRQLAGGCLCCALSSVTAVAIAQLLRSVKPDRLIIEPSGLAHPAQLLDMLQGGHLASSLALQPVVCLVDVTQFAGNHAAPAWAGSPLLADQVSIADVVVGSKADLADELALHAFHQWAAQLYPPKALVTTARRGELSSPGAAAALLAWPEASSSGAAGSSSNGGGGGEGGMGAAPAATQASAAAAAAQQEQQWLPPVQRPRLSSTAGSLWLSSSGGSGGGGGGGSASSGSDGLGWALDAAPPGKQPLRKEVRDASGAYAACGWIFNRDCVFSRRQLAALLQLLVPLALRVKGVFRVSCSAWVAVSAAPSAASPASVAGPAANAAAGAAEGAAAGAAVAAGAEPQAAAAPAAASTAAAVLAGVAAASQTAASTPAAELHDIAYRRDSRVEVILDVTAAAAAAAAGVVAVATGGPAGAGNGLEQRAAELSLSEPAIGSTSTNVSGRSCSPDAALQQQVLAAVGQAAAGDWCALEALICTTLVEPSPPAS